MQRMIEELFRWGELADFSQIHNGDPIRNMFHHVQGMRNKEICYVANLFFEIDEKIDNLRLYGNVQC